MLASTVIIVPGSVVGRIGVRRAGKGGGFNATTSGPLTVGMVDPGKAPLGKNLGECMLGQPPKLLGW